MALLFLATMTTPARADCSATPIADPDDMAISFLTANGVQAASASLLASSVKEGTLVYDDIANTLKVCDGTSWSSLSSDDGGLTGGTSGYLGVWTGASVLGTSGTSAGQQLFWDGTNHRLGIGTASPGQALDVSGNINASGNVDVNGTAYIGWERVSGATTANCTAGKVILGGGCYGTCTTTWTASDGWGGYSTVYFNGPPSGYPSSSTAYTCYCPTVSTGFGGGIVGGGTAYVICARAGN